MNWFTFAMSIITSIILLVLSEILKDLWLTPLQNYKILKQKIAKSLTYYSNIISNPISKINEEKIIEVYEKCEDDLRWLAADVDGFIQSLSWLKLGLPKRKILRAVSCELICLSNSLF